MQGLSILAFFLIVLPIRTAAQQIVVPRVGDWLQSHTTLSGSTQGMAMHNGHIVMLRDGGQCLVLNLQSRQAVAAFQLRDNNTHCNNASFSTLRLYGDAFPLLYISSCYGDKACLVTRLSPVGSSIVQRIYYDSPNFPVAQDWCLDAETGKLYAYGGRKGGPMFLKQFRLPSPATAEVHLTDTDVLRTIPINCVSVAQGSKIHNGHAYLPDGDRPGHYWLHIVNLDTGQEVHTIDLNNIGLEPEGIDIQDGWIYLSFHTPNPNENRIYRFPDPIK